MSNCIEFVNVSHVVTIPNAKIHHEAFKAFLESTSNGDDWVSGRSCAWWFLKDNTEFSPDAVVIRFGEGKSIHTNRDFDGTKQVLCRFMKSEHKHTFFITDEGDNFTKVYREKTVFKPTPIYNAQCPNCGEVWYVLPDSPDYAKCVAHEQSGKLDAIGLPDSCAHCQYERDKASSAACAAPAVAKPCLRQANRWAQKSPVSR